MLWIQEKEKESWEAASQALKKKLEVAESNCIRAEIEAAKMRSMHAFLIKLLPVDIDILRWTLVHSFWAGQLESEMSVQTQMLSSRDAELMALKAEV